MSDLQMNTGASLLQNVTADYNRLAGGEFEHARAVGSNGSSSGSSSSSSNASMEAMLGEITKLLQQVIDTLGGREDANEGGSSTNGSSGSSSGSQEPISGTGRIWGDPHFIGQDGDQYDVQGEAGKTYNLLSDQNFQMNGQFDSFGTDGSTVVGKVGISAGSDQIEVSKDGTVMVNGRELQEGDKVDLADGGSVEYRDGSVQVNSGEWETNIQFEGSGDDAHLNIDVKTDNAVADGVKPHGLLGQTFDADSDVRNGDKGSGAQGGGAIEGSNGNITSAGDRSAVEQYEVDGLYDRNFEDFNQFFDDAESDATGNSDRMNELVNMAMVSLAQSLMSLLNLQQEMTADA
jgi:von Willebrand factor type D domain